MEIQPLFNFSELSVWQLQSFHELVETQMKVKGEKILDLYSSSDSRITNHVLICDCLQRAAITYR